MNHQTYYKKKTFDANGVDKVVYVVFLYVICLHLLEKYLAWDLFEFNANDKMGILDLNVTYSYSIFLHH